MGFNIFDLLLPRETKFFAFMHHQVEYLMKGATTFKDLVENIETLSETDIREKIATIKECESLGDAKEREIFDALSKTFITPIDREDIHTLTINVDRALDILNSISRKIEIYNIRKVPSNVRAFADIIVKITGELDILIVRLQNKKAMSEVIHKMHDLEKEADELFHASMAELFSGNENPVHIIKFKEFYEHLESVVDAVDYVGKLVRGIKVKLG